MKDCYIFYVVKTFINISIFNDKCMKMNQVRPFVVLIYKENMNRFLKSQT